MYERAVTNIRICEDLSDSFPISIGLHQDLALSLILFVIVIDEIMKIIQDKVSLHILFADDTIQIDKTRKSISVKLEFWRDTRKFKGFILSWSKTKDMRSTYLSLNF